MDKVVVLFYKTHSRIITSSCIEIFYSITPPDCLIDDFIVSIWWIDGDNLLGGKGTSPLVEMIHRPPRKPPSQSLFWTERRWWDEKFLSSDNRRNLFIKSEIFISDDEFFSRDAAGAGERHTVNN